jgi:ATP-binding cassette subfamily C (CFTR/MRP) protein 1
MKIGANNTRSTWSRRQHRRWRKSPSSQKTHVFTILLALVASFFVVPTAPLSIIGTHASTPSTLIQQSSSSTTALRSTNSATSEFAPDTKKSKHNWKNGEYNSSLSSRLLYKYVDPLLEIASKRQLEPSDAFNVPNDKLMGTTVTKLEKVYAKCREKAKAKFASRKNQPSESTVLAKALLASQKQTLILTGVLRLLNTVIQAFPSLLIARLLRQIEAGNSIKAIEPLRSAFLLVSVLSAKMIIENQYFHNVVKCACEVRGSIGGLIFDKSLRLSSGSVAPSGNSKDKKKKKKRASSMGSGEVVNLMQSDATMLEMLTLQLHTIWDGALQIAIYIALLYKFLGTSVFWGLGVLLTTIPINALTLRILNRLSVKEIEAKDARMKKTTESVTNMQLLKLMSWEHLFARDIQSQREEEMRRHTKRVVVRAFSQAISNTAPAISLVATLTAYAKTGKPVVASTIFTAISLFNQLRFPLFFYPMLIDAIANGQNSLRRISSYLESQEIIPYVDYKPKLDGGGGSIEMTNGNFLWSAPACSSDEDDGSTDEACKSGAHALCGASISVQPGEVVAVIGGVGSGKSALVKSLIGELTPIPQNPKLIQQEYGSTADVPRVSAHGSIAYCAQEAWLPKGTIRESIVFGREFNEERYARAIYAAGLGGDDNLSHDTDVGEDGSNLSGGQRARVALARALYEESAGIYVLDDPLSALDASVGSTVFQRVTKRLREEKAATIFVTNDPNLPRQCDKVVLMGSDPKNGCSRIVDVGTYDELISRGHDLRTITHTEEDESTTEEGNVGSEDIDVSIVYHSSDISLGANTTSSHADSDSHIALEEDPTLLAEHTLPQSTESSEDIITPVTNQQRQLSTDDTMSTGSIPRSTYLTYFRSVKNPLLIAFALASYFASNGSQFFQQLIIAKWTEASSGGIAAAVSAKYCRQLVYAAAGVSFTMCLRSYLTMKVGVRASKTIHRAMIKSVFGAPISFFSSTPSGQLLTRFGKELEVVDRSLPDGLASVLYCFLQVFFSTLALAGVVTPLMAIPIGLVGIFYVKTMGLFRPAARDLKRIESKSRSPIYTQFREALSGAETIRSFKATSLWSRKHRHLSDENLSIYYAVKSLDRWLSVRLETLGNTVVFSAAVASILLTRGGRLKSGSAGWGLTQALSITGLLAWCVRVLTDLETQFMSVMRTVELTDLESETVKGIDEAKPRMPRELSRAGEALKVLQPSGSTSLPPLPESDADLLQSGWPWRGHVQFKNVSMRYNPSLPLVLKNVSVDVPAGSTLGVVGRTGE